MNLRHLLLTFLFFAGTVQAAELPGISAFIEEMVARYQFDRDELTADFQHAEHRPEIIVAMNRPATIKPWWEYRAAFLTPKRINGGVSFWQAHAETLQRASQQYGVPPEIIVALLGVETEYGRNTGKFRALDALTTLAFDYSRRADFFRRELENYLLLAREQNFKRLEIKSSFAGALGWPQFMPSSYRQHAVDFNGNGQIDLFNEVDDIIGSVAHYLQTYGWQTDAPIAERFELAPSEINWSQLSEQMNAFTQSHPPAKLLDFSGEAGKEYWYAFENFQVIRRYNNSNYYVMAVFQLAEAIRQAHH